MTPVLTTERIRPPNRPAFPARLTALVAAGVVAATGTVMLLLALEGPSFVDEVNVVNGTVYRFNVAVAGPDDDGVVELGALGRDDQNRFQAVLDQGDVWVFSFSYGGVDGGEVSVTRDELEAAGWTLDVPAAAEERLRQSGVTPSAPYL